MDGADQSAHDLPKVVGRIPKGLKPWPQKLQCVVTHGVSISMYNILNVVKGGGNMALTCLMAALQSLGRPLRGTLYLQVDGGSENWNHILFGFIDLLFDLYSDLQKVIVSRLPVGHTHIDVDRFFSYFNGVLFGTCGGGRSSGKDVYTKPVFDEMFMSAMSGNKDTMLLDHHIQDVNNVYDWWSFLQPHLYDGFSGYGSSGAVHVLKFERRQDMSTPHISYKYWNQSTEWLPEDGTTLKVLSSRPDLSDLKNLKLETHVEDYADVLTRLQKPVLKWMTEQRQSGLVTEDDVSCWKAYFKSLRKCMLIVKSHLVIAIYMSFFLYR